MSVKLQPAIGVSHWLVTSENGRPDLADNICCPCVTLLFAVKGVGRNELGPMLAGISVRDLQMKSALPLVERLRGGEYLGMACVANAGGGASRGCPPAVRYGCVLLSIQASLWALVSLGAVAVCADRTNWQSAAARGTGQLAGYVAASIAAVALAVGLSVVSFLLAFRLERGRNKARAIAVVLEAAMTFFGVLVAYYTASAGAGIIAILPASAGVVGSALSATAAITLLGGKARAFTRMEKRDGPLLAH